MVDIGLFFCLALNCCVYALIIWCGCHHMMLLNDVKYKIYFPPAMLNYNMYGIPLVGANICGHKSGINEGKFQTKLLLQSECLVVSSFPLLGSE